jgi:hypothetical protein
MAQINGDFIAKECRAAFKYIFLKENSAEKKFTMTCRLH